MPRPSEAEVEQRRQEILSYVMEHGDVRIDQLTERFGVSLMTMHRDLDELAERRLLRKLRGRVEAYPALTMETAKRFRETENVALKESLAEVASHEVTPGQTLFLDDSTTLFPLAHRLIGPQVVITNSLEVARILADADGIEVRLLGGRYTEFDSCVGPDTIGALSRMRADVGFVSATAVACGRLYHPDREYAELKTAALRVADRNVLVVDHSKFGRTATYAYGDVSDYDLVITDEETPGDELAAMDTKVRLAKPVTSRTDHGGTQE
ncbi:DeoR/GlpR family DNA-binding transcription regulator [Amycolatopsis alkalitolerans]|uniref:Lactose phosphotransferase system repressor n=1 Tax=Amycolatopsis alkalitolerans TaxID=2547244 RepID=A0A5C4M898_9PSEU|nr:DeoR/GlpR family DNA-binding transcription regulator [Amycolatopsis alkalitolerans]TNC28736.1 DeoR/GlpR transcriptional regulator [Amycolatopsis alkalitolerans]